MSEDIKHDFARNLDDQLLTRQEWCTCSNPYFCNGSELEVGDEK